MCHAKEEHWFWSGMRSLASWSPCCSRPTRSGSAPIVQHAKEVLVSGQRKNPEHSAQVLREA